MQRSAFKNCVYSLVIYCLCFRAESRGAVNFFFNIGHLPLWVLTVPPFLFMDHGGQRVIYKLFSVLKPQDRVVFFFHMNIAFDI